MADVDISRHPDTDTYLAAFGGKNSARQLSLCLRGILDLGRGGILVNALHACRHASLGIIELAGTNDLVIRRLQDKVVEGQNSAGHKSQQMQALYRRKPEQVEPPK